MDDQQTLNELTEFYHEQLQRAPAALEALRLRQVGPEEIDLWQIGYSPWGKDLPFDRHSLLRCGVLEQDHDRLEGRIIFPDRLPGGQVVGYCGWSFDYRATKYVTTKTTDYYRRSELLFGLYLLSHEDRSKIVLTEGPFDAVAIWKEYGEGARAVSVGGSKVSDHQVEMIRRYIGMGDVFLAFDSDDSGRRGADLFRRRHAHKFRRVVEVLFPIEYNDPAEWLQAESKDRGILRYREHKRGSSKTANGGET